MEHMTSSQDRLSLFVVIPIGTKQITVTTYNLFCFWIPDNQLLIAIFTYIELIDIHILASTSTSLAESNLAKSSNLLHYIRSIMGCYDIYLIMTLICHSELAFWSKLTFEYLFGYRLDNFLFHSLFLKKFIVYRPVLLQIQPIPSAF